MTNVFGSWKETLLVIKPETVDPVAQTGLQIVLEMEKPIGSAADQRSHRRKST